MPDDILAWTKFCLPISIPCDVLWDGYNMAVATGQHANGKFTFLSLLSIFSGYQFPSTSCP